MGISRGSGSTPLPALILFSVVLLAGALVPRQLLPPAELLAARGEAAQLQTDAARLSQDIQELEAALAASDPEEIYLVVDTQANLLYVYQGDIALRVAVVSTGSGRVLTDPASTRWWSFESPRGVRRVLKKTKKPVWNKPDWAFLEEGQEPPESIADRREKGSLGEWALDLGDGYMIHGTLYERLLGRSLTHGCIRVGRDDLRVVANAASPGTPVYIF